MVLARAHGRGLAEPEAAGAVDPAADHGGPQTPLTIVFWRDVAGDPLYAAEIMAFGSLVGL